MSVLPTRSLRHPSSEVSAEGLSQNVPRIVTSRSFKIPKETITGGSYRLFTMAPLSYLRTDNNEPTNRGSCILSVELR